MYPNLSLYIDGEWTQGSSGRTEPVINPATEEVLAELPHASRADLDAALDAAQRGFKLWSTKLPLERARVLKKIADLLRERSDDLGRVMTLEQGKTLTEAKMEVMMCAETFEWMAEEGKRVYGRIVPSRFGHNNRLMVVYEPAGPVAAFTPWNFPMLMPARKLAAALAAGCSAIIKPSEETPGCTIALAQVCADAGLPAGVLNVVFGVPAEVSEYVIPHPAVRKVTFTGSIPVGKHLAALAAREMKKFTMELGGHAPVVIFDDVDVDKVAKMAAAGKFRNAGQVCVSPTRFYVHESIHDRFVQTFTDISKSLKIGNGLDESTQMGPLANPRRLDAMDDFVGDARERGATIQTGGNRIGNQGFFFEPTVISELDDDAKIMNQEPFGPLAPVARFSTLDEVIERANRLPVGLAAYAFTGSNKRAMALSEGLEAGMVGVNSFNIAAPEAPFGGVKDSGMGREAGSEGLLEHFHVKMVSLTED
ncbi:MAG: NAD-dependent succinate-semialdehyde dehydrogenase [Candidatus Competibacteraceae bacterium]|nr:NAD-dependent succinate-semialdehyde dehydrogenase [Candidatus Competibacteraceae bacterium]